MQRSERLSITLPADMAADIRGAVGHGYASNSEVIREAVRYWQELRQQRAVRLDGIRAKIVEADRDPNPSLTEEEVDRHFSARLKAAAHGDHA